MPGRLVLDAPVFVAAMVDSYVKPGALIEGIASVVI
jgi:hypothetical protein